MKRGRTPLPAPVPQPTGNNAITPIGSGPDGAWDYSIPKPESFLVPSIADTGTIEVQLQLVRA